MGSIAPLVAGFQRRLRNLPGPLQGAAPRGIPILTQQFPNATLRLLVEFAFGADLTASSGSWVWTDVTSDVQVDGGKHVTINVGRQDERSVAGPASCTIALDNRLSKYSSTALGQNWPNVTRGTPVRVRALPNGNAPLGNTLFQGYAASFVPQFDSTGRWGSATVTANGLLRRLGQGSAPTQSTLRTYTPNVASLVAYWPMEDGSSATSFAAAGPAGVYPMSFAGTPQLHSNSTCVGSDSLPVLAGSTWASVPSYAPTNQVQVRMLVAFPLAASALPDQTVILRVFTNGSIAYWDVLYLVGGALKAQGHSAVDGSVVFDTGPVGFAVDGTGSQISLALSQSGSDVAVTLSKFTQSGAVASYANATAAAQTVIGCAFIQLLPNTISTTQVAMGHVTVQSAVTDIFENAQPVSAYDGEWAHDRQGRLLVLAGAESRGMFTDSNGGTTRMGPQPIDTVINLIRECEATAVAFLVDGLDASVKTSSHTNVENSAASLTIDATSGALVPPFQVTDDDQLLTNEWTLTQRNGSPVTFTDTAGTYGVNKVGRYQNSETVNVDMNQTGSLNGAFGIKAVLDRAAWLVHETTVEGYRIPTLEIAFHHNPELLSTWLSTVQGAGVGRIDITNLSTVYPQLPSGTVSLLAVGFSHTIDQFTWTTTINCIPFLPWRVGVAAQTAGDTNEYVLRADTSGSSLVVGVDVGATSLSVATTSGPVWTTDADDVPFQVRIGGIPVTVTAVSGASSPQTFTVDPATVSKGLAVNSDVRLWNPTVLAIGVTA